MKKTFALCLSLALVGVFFLFPVYAATGSPAVHKSASGSSQGVTWEIDLDQYYPEQYAESGIASGQVNTMVYYRITNSNDNAAYVRNTGFTINWVTAPYITDYKSYSDDLYIGYQNTTGSWYIYADSPYSYSSGIVVPPHSSLYCVGVITTSGSVNGNSISSQAISSVSLSSHSVTLGDYPFGSVGQQIDEIEGLLSDIKTQLQFTGTFTPVTDVSYAWRTFQFADLGMNMPSGFNGSLNILRLSSFSLSETAVAALGNFTYQHDCYIIPFQFSLYINNNTGHAVSVNNIEFRIEEMFDRTSVPSIMIYGFDSELFDTPRLQAFNASNFTDFVLPIKLQYNNVPYLPYGKYFVNFTVLVILDSINSSYSYNPNMHSSMNITSTNLDFYTPTNAINGINNTLTEIYNYLTEQNQDLNDKADDVSDDSASVTEQIEYVHQQEMAFFEANEDAIEATGLSNFHYNQNTISAFTMITNQFASVWNALSDYTLVFIFTLLLSLATFIIRHEPTTKMKQYRTSVAAERAERISYYGRMNAQSRASVRNDGDSYFWDAVRRNNM